MEILQCSDKTQEGDSTPDLYSFSIKELETDVDLVCEKRREYMMSVWTDQSRLDAYTECVNNILPHLHILDKLLTVGKQCSLVEKCYVFDVCNRICLASDDSPDDKKLIRFCNDTIDFIGDMMSLSSNKDFHTVNQYTELVVKLNDHLVLSGNGINKYLILISFIRIDVFEKHRGIISWNMKTIQKGILNVVKQCNKEHLDFFDLSGDFTRNRM